MRTFPLKADLCPQPTRGGSPSQVGWEAALWQKGTLTRSGFEVCRIVLDSKPLTRETT